jgi:hypothetical protein
MRRTVVGYVKNNDPVTRHTSEDGLRRFAGGRNVLKASAYSNAYYRKSPN